MPTEPRHSYKKYKFNWDTHEWAIDLVATERLIRSIRNNLFANIDKMNPVWYSTLSDQQKQELVDYRQAIIDITDQPNFPLDVVFPTAPTWL